MSYRAEITKAIEYIEANPPVLPEASDWPQSLSKLTASSVSKYAFLAGQPDEAALTFVSGTSPPNQIFVKGLTREEFNTLVRDYFDVMGEKPDDAQVHDYFEHESQHLSIARKLGALGCEIGIALHLLPRVGGTDLAHSMQPIAKLGSFDTTKLGAALICSYPEAPSAADLQDVVAMGYDGVEDVAERIIYRNKRPYYPLPLSYDLSSTSKNVRLRRQIQTRLLPELRSQ